MDNLTSSGYQKRDIQTIKDEIVEELQSSYPSFSVVPADIQNMLIDTSIVGIANYENLMYEMINGYAPSFANDFMFRQLGSSLGLTPKDEFQSQVTLQFSGPVGSIIPSGIKVGNFETRSSAVISTTGRVLVQALSTQTEIAEANTLTTISQNLSNIEVTNPSASLGYVDAETFSDYKKRVQQRLRSPRQGGIDYALSLINSLDGVVTRQVAARKTSISTTINGQATILQGIEVIVGGGDSNEIANCLSQAFLETQKLISSPSNDETDRKASVNLILYGNSFEVQYTIPKNLNLSIIVNFVFEDVTTTALSIETFLADAITEYINNKQVGEKLNKNTLDYKIMELLNENGISPEQVATMTYTLQVDGVDTDWNDNGYLSEIEFDTYLTLSYFAVTLNA